MALPASTTASSSYLKVYSFGPPGSKLVWLDGIGALFDQYRVLSAAILYKPFVGTNTPGSIVVGVSFDEATPTEPTAATTIGDLAQHDPSFVGSLWQPFRMSIPVQQRASLRLFRTGTVVEVTKAFHLICKITGPPSSTVGVFECQYVVEFMSPRKSITTTVSENLTRSAAQSMMESFDRISLLEPTLEAPPSDQAGYTASTPTP